MSKFNSMLGDKVYFYFFDLVDGTGSGVRSDMMCEYKELEVVYENEMSVILNTPELSKVSKPEVEGMGTAINRPFVHLRISDSYWGNTVSFLFYSTTKYSPKDLKEILRSEISKKTGGILRLDLSGLDKIVTGEGCEK